MHTVRMYFGPVDLTYYFKVGYMPDKSVFIPMVACETLQHAVLLANCLNGGELRGDITPYMNVMMPHQDIVVQKIEPSGASDYLRGVHSPVEDDSQPQAKVEDHVTGADRAGRAHVE